MLKFWSSIFHFFSYVLMFSYFSLGALSFGWAIYLSYNEYGLVAAIVTFFLPVISQIFWVFMLWTDEWYTSNFILFVIIGVASYLVSLAVLFIITLINNLVEFRDSRKNHTH